jgi:hypothetical protein
MASAAEEARFAYWQLRERECICALLDTQERRRAARQAAAVRLQATACGLLARRLREYLQQSRDRDRICALLDARARRRAPRQAAVVRLQAAAHVLLERALRKGMQERAAAQRQAAVRLQAVARSFLARRRLHELRTQECEWSAAALRLQAAARGFLMRRQAWTAAPCLRAVPRVLARPHTWTAGVESSSLVQAHSRPVAVCLIHSLQVAASPVGHARRALQLPNPLLPSVVVRRQPEASVAASCRRPSRGRLRWPSRGCFHDPGKLLWTTIRMTLNPSSPTSPMAAAEPHG